MTDRIDPVRRRPLPLPVGRVEPLARRAPEDRDEAPTEGDEQPRRRPEPPDDGRPHIDVLA